jgi:hypothetical protein
MPAELPTTRMTYWSLPQQRRHLRLAQRRSAVESLFRICLLFLWTAAGIGCRRDDTPQDRNPADFQRYLVESSQFIETEYTVYKFLSDELRPVYVGGNRGTNTGLTWVLAKDHFV